MTDPQVRALIVEDERLTRRDLAAMIRSDGRLRIAGEAGTLVEAVSMVQRLAPDVVFLDVHLGAESGFDLLEHCDGSAIVFVTAHDEHAIRAFEVNALDYLLKPVAAARLAEAIDRVAAVRAAAATRALPPLDEGDRLFLRLGDRWGFVPVTDIAAVLAEGNYSRVCTIAGAECVMKKSLDHWQARLPPRQFVRVHRSAIANVDLVERVVEWSNYSFRVHIRGLAEPVIMSRRYALKLKRLLG